MSDGIYKGSKFPGNHEITHVLTREFIDKLRAARIMGEFYHCDITLREDDGLVGIIQIREYEEGLEA